MCHLNVTHQVNGLLWVNSNAFPLHEQGPRCREVSTSAMLSLDDPNKDKGSQDMDLDPDTDDANDKHGQVENREESPNNPEAALVSQSKKQFKKSSKHATITENEIEPVMEEFICVEHLLDGHPH